MKLQGLAEGPIFESAWTVDGYSYVLLRLCCLDSDIPCRRCRQLQTWSSWFLFSLKTDLKKKKRFIKIREHNKSKLLFVITSMLVFFELITVLTCGRAPTSPATTSSSASMSEAARTFWSSCWCSYLDESIKSSSSIPANFVITCKIIKKKKSREGQ